MTLAMFRFQKVFLPFFKLRKVLSLVDRTEYFTQKNIPTISFWKLTRTKWESSQNCPNKIWQSLRLLCCSIRCGSRLKVQALKFVLQNNVVHVIGGWVLIHKCNKESVNQICAKNGPEGTLFFLDSCFSPLLTKSFNKMSWRDDKGEGSGLTGSQISTQGDGD